MSKYDNTKKPVPHDYADNDSPPNEPALSAGPTQSVGITYTVASPTGETPHAEKTKVDANDYLSPEKAAKKKRRKRFKSAMRREKASNTM